MIENTKQYMMYLSEHIPLFIYEGLFAAFCVGSILLLFFKGMKIGRDIAKLLLLEYLTIFFLSTVIYRVESNLRRFDYTPFWSYVDADLRIEIIMNVIAFIPIGILLGCSFKGMRWWIVLLIGGGFSILTEVLQLIMKRGFSEVDDVIHNSMGCLLGYGIYLILKRPIRRFYQ